MNRLYEANKELAKELFAIKSSLDVYNVIGLNAGRIEVGKKFFGYIQRQSLERVALGLSKVFEKEKNYKLCSIRGIYHLAKEVPIREVSVVRQLVEKYGGLPSCNWIQDIDQVLLKQRPKLKAQMRRIGMIRDTRIAHMQQNAPVSNLPSVAAFEDLIGFAFDFYSFIDEAFLQTHPHSILRDTEVVSSLLNVFKKSGVVDVVSRFKDKTI